MTSEEFRGIVCNPLYVGIGPSRPQIVEEDWARSAAQEISEHGAELPGEFDFYAQKYHQIVKVLILQL